MSEQAGRASYSLPRRRLGRTGVSLGPLAFGCGPVSDLMTGPDQERQMAVFRSAIDGGIDWFDTAATYGQGRSEESLGRVLKTLPASRRPRVATKVRLAADDLGQIARASRASLISSLERLGLEKVTLLQLHNAITLSRGDLPTSLTVADVLGRDGVLPAFRKLQDEGLVEHIGLTAVGSASEVRRVVTAGEFDTLQVPFHLLNQSAGREHGHDALDDDHGNVMQWAARHDMGIFAIRVFAAGALLNQEPSTHTTHSRFFPLELYQRDRRRAAKLAQQLGGWQPLYDAAIRLAAFHPPVSAAIIGFGEAGHIELALESVSRGPLSDSVLSQLASA